MSGKRSEEEDTARRRQSPRRGASSGRADQARLFLSGEARAPRAGARAAERAATRREGLVAGRRPEDLPTLHRCSEQQVMQLWTCGRQGRRDVIVWQTRTNQIIFFHDIRSSS